MARPLLTLLLALLLGGCQLWALDRQVKMAQRSMVLIPGQLQATAAQPALVALYAEGNLLAYRSVRPGGFFYFSMAAGDYSLLAFEDRNGNLRLDPDEPRHWQAQARTAPLQGRVQRREDELSMIVYTSGSTGTPKGSCIACRRSFCIVASDLIADRGPSPPAPA